MFRKGRFSKKKDANGFEIIVDTKITLLIWMMIQTKYDRYHLIITSENITKTYLNYLYSKNISCISIWKFFTMN